MLDADAVRDDRAGVAVRVGDDARLKEGEVCVVAAVERELSDGALADEETQLGRARVDQRGVVRDR